MIRPHAADPCRVDGEAPEHLGEAGRDGALGGAGALLGARDDHAVVDDRVALVALAQVSAIEGGSYSFSFICRASRNRMLCFRAIGSDPTSTN